LGPVLQFFRANLHCINGDSWYAIRGQEIARSRPGRRAGVSYNKVENRRRLMTTVHRSEGSIERKLQNISAVLGVEWINGYKPLNVDSDGSPAFFIRRARKSSRWGSARTC
jgi:hypothetical protein